MVTQIIMEAIVTIIYKITMFKATDNTKIAHEEQIQSQQKKDRQQQQSLLYHSINN